MATDGSDRDNCAVCLAPYNDPKFLTCFHTFCAKCIQDVADRYPRGTFPCPACRKPNKLPSRGASALQSNFYITPCGKKDRCNTHKQKKLEFYCVMCDKPLCINCLLTEHQLHKIEDLHAVADRKKNELKADLARLAQAVANMAERVGTTEREQKALLDKEKVVERNISERHATIVAAADKFRDEALDSLRSVSADIRKRIDRILKQQRGNLDKLRKTRRDLDQAVRTGTDGEVIAVTKAMKSGCGSKHSVRRLMTTQMIGDLSRPVLHFNVTTDVMVQKVGGFLGTVSRMDTKATVPEMTVTKRFRCGADTDTEIFSLCPVDEDPPSVWVSYERRGLETEEAPSEQFNEQGKLLYTSTAFKGKSSYKRYAKGEYMCTGPYTGGTIMSKSPTAGGFRLESYCSGEAIIRRVNVTSTHQYNIEKTAWFTIDVGDRRAFDVDDTEQFFAVIEEARSPYVLRKVLLYRRPEKNACADYTPPTAVFQPSDVCFCRMNGQQLLLVADELNDAIHVVDLQNGLMVFLCWLAPGCPLLVQPTAMNSDASGRLWVACRGGNIITIEAKNSQERSVFAESGVVEENQEDEDEDEDEDDEYNPCEREEVTDLEARLNTFAVR